MQKLLLGADSGKAVASPFAFIGLTRGWVRDGRKVTGLFKELGIHCTTVVPC